MPIEAKKRRLFAKIFDMSMHIIIQWQRNNGNTEKQRQRKTMRERGGL